MNLHHVELFYYVARHRGIAEAARKIPYGIQQPAVSAQIAQLEKDLGVVLFRRRPFALTAEGEELYAFIRNFFDEVLAVGDRIRGGASQLLRVGASEVVLRDYLPQLLDELHREFPKMRLMLRDGYQVQLLDWIVQGELDVAITLVEGRAPMGIRSKPLLQLPLVLLVPKSYSLKSVESLWSEDVVRHSLITLPRREPLYRSFENGLKKRGIVWEPSIEVSTLELVQTYVEAGYGIGLGVGLPGKPLPSRRLRVLRLEGFDPLTLGLFWQGPSMPVRDAFCRRVEDSCQRLEQQAVEEKRGRR